MKREHFMALLLSLSALVFGEDKPLDLGSPIASHLLQVKCIESLLATFDPHPNFKPDQPELSERDVDSLMAIANVANSHSQILLWELQRDPVESDAKKLREALDKMTSINKRILALLEPYIKRHETE